MNAWTFCSCLAPRMETFINLRRLSGTDYQRQTESLAYFDRFLVRHGVQEVRMTREMCDGYRDSLSALAPSTQVNRFCVVRLLCEYLARTDSLSYIPERLPWTPSPHRPYILTHEQVIALLGAALRLTPAGSLRPHTVHTLLGLLYTTGLRIGEACALNIEHFLPDERKLYVAEGKFRKSRWLVLSGSTTEAVRQYLNRRMDEGVSDSDSPLLLNQRRRRVCPSTVQQTFKQLLQNCGIRWVRGIGPRLHDIRHTFAVHRLLAWYRDGEDVNARLPALATYMGHVKIRSTQVYLQPTAELLGEVDRRFHDHYLNHIASKGNPS